MDVVQISPADIGIVATIIGSFLELYKMFPALLLRIWKVDISEELSKTIPVCAIITGMLIDYFFVEGVGATAKSVLFNGAMCGLTAIGGRQAVNAYMPTKDKPVLPTQ